MQQLSNIATRPQKESKPTIETVEKDDIENPLSKDCENAQLIAVLALIKLAESKPTDETGRNDKGEFAQLKAATWTKGPYICITCLRNHVSESDGYLINQKCKECARKT